ncbi:hypothetical protein [Streptomyces sp. NPDC051546]|uniref:hypothetical protein n=1 Tax=Streptomyces sp. NPDC051546 TaxID=3365655 RepID=UPI0037B7E090
MGNDCITCEPVRLAEVVSFDADTQGAALLAAGAWMDVWEGWEASAASWARWSGGWTLTLHMSR